MMMKPVLALGLALALGACAAAGPARPVAARMNAEQLTVTLSDGVVCRTPWAAGAGRMEPCGLDWQVAVDGRPNIFRQLFAGLAGALGMEGAVPPMAEVTLTGADGRRHVFASPPPLPEGSWKDD
jgi:hypothetical protein